MKMKLILYGIAATLLAAFAFYVKSCTGKKAKEITAIAKATQDTGTRRRDANGIEHFSKATQVGTFKELAVFSQAQMDSAVKSAGISKRQLTGVTNVNVGVAGTGQTPIKPITIRDTVHGMPVGWQGNYFNYEAPFTTITGYVDIEHDTTCIDTATGQIDTCKVPGKATIFYAFDVPITVIDYWKPKHKFLWFIRRRKITRTDVSSANPNARIINFTAIKVKE